MTSAPLFGVENIVAGYGRGETLHGVSLEVREGEIVCLLGPNGAGKSTLLRVMAGLLRARKGTVRLGDHDITSLSPYVRAGLGFALVPEERSAFPDLTVEQNLILGALSAGRASDRKWLMTHQAQVFELFPQLKERAGQEAHTLSGGEQKMLVVGRALMSDPSVLVLDEPSQGLAPKLVDAIAAALAQIRHERGISIVVAEQDADRALDWSDRAYVMSDGAITFSGTAEQLRKDTLLMERLFMGDVL
jgi:branched-chain amino acid transport system ATP-binding protein